MRKRYVGIASGHGGPSLGLKGTNREMLKSKLVPLRMSYTPQP